MNLLTFLTLITLVFALSGEQVQAKKMYRWVDENGDIIYSGQLPPDQVKHRRESLNENARVVGVLEKEKSEVQRELDKRLVILKKRQDKIITKQKSRDKVLLSTFRSLRDMGLVLKGKMLALDRQQKMLQGKVDWAKQQLLQQQKKAAQYERDGKKIPKFLLDGIADSKAKIELSKGEVVKQIARNKQEKKRFEKDMDRFAYLTQSDMSSKTLSLKTAEVTAEKELGLFICESFEQCDKAWEIAKQFVRDISTSKLDMETDKLIMSQAPYKDTDISLSVSKMDVTKDKQQLFLDIRCRKSTLGRELCRSDKIKKIRHSFSKYIKSALARKQEEEDRLLIK